MAEDEEDAAKAQQQVQQVISQKLATIRNETTLMQAFSGRPHLGVFKGAHESKGLVLVQELCKWLSEPRLEGHAQTALLFVEESGS